MIICRSLWIVFPAWHPQAGHSEKTGVQIPVTAGSPCECELLTLILAQSKNKPRFEMER